jgi:hypothetical protein
MVQVDKEGFPVWGNPSPQKPFLIPGRQIVFMVQDARLNQVPRGRDDEIPFLQKPRAKQGKPEGPGYNTLMESGEYGTSLIDRFMARYNEPAPLVRTP